MTNTTTAPQARDPIAELRAVNKTFLTAGGHDLQVLQDIDVAVHEGELLALLGQSGSGKSTILRCLTGLIQPTSGRVLHRGHALRGVNTDASIVFQTFALYPWLTVEQNVAVGLLSREMPRAERDAAVDRAIDIIGLGNYHKAFPRELSGGMRQRVGIARAGVAAAPAVPGRSLQRARRADGREPAPGTHQPLACARRGPVFHLHGDAQHRGSRRDGHAHRGALSASGPPRPGAGQRAAVSARHAQPRVPAPGQHHPRVHHHHDPDRVRADIATALPYDNPERIFETMIAWGRYAGLMDFNAATGMVFVPKEDEDEVD